MITPGLFRRSFARAAQWRLLLLFAVGTAIPALLASFPLFTFLSSALDRAVQSSQLARQLDFATFVDLVKLGETPQAGGIPVGAMSGLVVALLIAPALAGMAVAVARSSETLSTRELLAGAGENYGRMLRMVLVALLPLGIAGALAGVLLKLASGAAEKAVTEGAADRAVLRAQIAAGVLLFIAHLFVDAGRAMFAAQPGRRSAFFAWLSGVRLAVRRPGRALLLGLIGTGVAVVGAFVLIAARDRIPRHTGGGVLAAFVVTQLAAACVGWGRAFRLIGLADLGRADAAERARKLAPAFEMAPPKTSPPPPAEPALVAVEPETKVS